MTLVKNGSLVMKVRGSVILVTGAAHGIGRGIVEQLVEAGTKVAFTYRNDAMGAKETESTLGAKVKAYHVEELADDAACEDLFQRVMKDFGHIDAVIANASGAGKAGRDEDLNDLDLEQWNESLKDNLLVAITTAKHAVKALNKNDQGGKIIFIGSVLGLDYMGNPKITAYSAGKAATHNFAKTIAKSLAPKILVNVVAPGRCWSKAYEGAPKELVKEKFIVNRHDRPIQEKEIGQMVQAVLENDSMIGQVVTVDAGFSLRDT